MGKKAAGAVIFVVGFMSATMAAVFFQQVGSGMVGYWKCDDASAPTVDSSGGGNIGSWISTVTSLTGAANTPKATAWSAGCLNFGGVTAQVSIPGTAALTITGDLTVAFWMYPNADGPDWQRLVGKGNATDRTFGVWREPTTGHHILFQQYNAGGPVINITSATTTPNTAWTHVTCRVSGTTATVFLNGVSDVTGTRTGPPSAVTADPLTFAYAGFHTSFPGRLDDVRYYNRALSDADIAALAAGGEGPAAPTGLTATPGSNQVLLNWTALPAGAVYNVKRSTVSGGSPPGVYTTLASNVGTNSYTDSTAVSGTTYYYVVSGVTYGEGPNSNEASARPGEVTALPLTGLQTTESGGTAVFNVTYNQAAPAGGSTLTVTSNNAAQGGLVSSPTNPTPAASITITVAPGFTGSIPITVTGADDQVVTPNTAYTVSVTATGFAGLVIPDIQLTNLERDTLGIVVSKSSLTTTTAGGQDSFTVQLNSKPAPGTSVSISVTSSDPTEGTVSPTPLLFTPTNWNVAQLVTVTGVGVNLTYVTTYYTVSLTVQAGSDPLYVGLTNPPSGSPVQISAANLHLETPPALPKVWGGCGLLGLEFGLPLLLLHLARRRRRVAGQHP